MRSANEILMDQAITRGLYLERYKSSQVQDMITILNTEIEPPIIEILKRHAGGTLTRRQASAVQRAATRAVIRGYRDLSKQSRKELAELGILEADWQAKALRVAVETSGVGVITPQTSVLRALHQTEPIHGKLMSTWFEDTADVTARRVNQQIMVGYSEGEGIDKIVRRIKGTKKHGYRDGILNRARHELRTLVRTSVAGVSSNYRNRVMKENTDVIKKIGWVSTLDTRTCEICMGLDGRSFDVDKGPRQPIHLGCRCTTIPILKSWKELGINLKEAPPGTRASMGGQVPPPLNYPGWLRKNIVEGRFSIVEEALGKTKAKMFRSGRVTIKEFAVSDRRILTIKELRNLN